MILMRSSMIHGLALLALASLVSCGDDDDVKGGPLGDVLDGIESNEFSFLRKDWIWVATGKHQVGDSVVLGVGDGIGAPWKGKVVQIIQVESHPEFDKVHFTVSMKAVDQDVDLELRQDQLWYLVGADLPFTGIAFSYYPGTRSKKSRTIISEGQPKGLIDEWNPDGSRKGGGFADDFKSDK